MKSVIPTFALRLATLAALVLAAACETTLVPETASLEPARLGTRVATEYVRHGPCDIASLDRTVLMGDTLPRPTDAEMIAGFNNTLAVGAQPAPCNRQQSQVYEGAILFDLSAFEGVIVDRAVLSVERRPTAIPWRPRTPDRPFSSTRCQVEWETVREEWSDRYDSGPGVHFAGPPIRLEGGRLRPRGSFDEGVLGTVELNVTRWVQEWVTGRRPNNGFLARQVKEYTATAAGANNESCTNLYTNARLDLELRRFVRTEE